MHWLDEFGPEFDCPDEITTLEGVEDLSWHNDTCPSFGRAWLDGELTVRCWTDHPDPDKREMSALCRYSVVVHAGTPEAAAVASQLTEEWEFAPIVESDDPSEAARGLVAAILSVNTILR